MDKSDKIIILLEKILHVLEESRNDALEILENLE